MPYPEAPLLPSETTYPGFGPGEGVLSSSGLILVRDRPPLYETIDIETPSGRHYRWGEDEMRPEHRPEGVSYSDAMPGGDDTLDATLPRKPNIDYSDLASISGVVSSFGI